MTGFTGATHDGDSVSWDIVQDYMSESTHKPISLWNTSQSRNVFLYPYQRPSSPLLTVPSQKTQKWHKGIFGWKSVDHIDVPDCQPKTRPESHSRRTFLAFAARLWRRLKKNDDSGEDMDFFDRPLSEATMVETQEDMVLDWREKLQRASEGRRVTTASVPNLSHVHRLTTTHRSPPTSYRPPYLPSATSYNPPRRSASARPYTPSQSTSNLHRAPTYPLPRTTSAPNLRRGSSDPHRIGRARSINGSSRGRCPPFPSPPPLPRSNSVSRSKPGNSTPYYYF